MCVVYRGHGPWHLVNMKTKVLTPSALHLTSRQFEESQRIYMKASNIVHWLVRQRYVRGLGKLATVIRSGMV